MSQVPQAGEMHDLFARALAEPAERRAALLDQTCAGRPDLRERIERLLQLAEGASGFLDRGAIQAGSAEVTYESSYAAGRTIGAYRLLRPLGRGGMAEVWLAERREGGFQQQAALKLIPHARGSIGQRFFGEREILAGLVHPGVARLYDGGVEADGTAYMVMEYVAGEHLIAYANAHRLSLSERLNLFLQICDAVAYAHTRLVVHRDLKPSNILVTSDGQAKLLDFGIAKLIDAESSGDATRTHYLSPAYAAPEQLVNGAISTSTDVYALGVILFELLTGRLPWSDDAAPMAAAVKRLLDAPLPPPSKLATAQSPVAARALRGDLDAIAGKALRREANERYPDARSLADDVRRYLDHRPVQARIGARIYVARRFVRRNWLPLSSVALLFVAMAAATAAVAWQAQKARMEAQRAEREARTATSVQEFLREVFRANSSAQSDPVRARQTTARELLDLGAKKIDAAMADAPEAKIGVLRLLGDLYKDLEMKDEQVRLRRQAVDIALHRYGEEAPELAAALIDLGDAVYGSKDEKESEAILGEARTILDRRHDDRSTLRGRLMLKQAQLYRLTDRPLSLDYSQRAVRLFEALPVSMSLAEALQLQARVQSINGNAQDAVASMNRAVGVLRALPDGRPGLSEAYGGLATFQLEVLDYNGAERNARSALESSLAVNGEQHVQTVRRKTALGAILFQLGRTRESLDLLTRAKQQFLALPGAESPTDVAYVLGTRASYYRLAGDFETSMNDIGVAVKTLRRGAKNVTLGVAIAETAATWMELGRYDAAHEALDEAAAIREAAGQKPGTAAFNPVIEKRVDLAVRQRRFDEAARMLDSYVVPEGAGERLPRFALVREILTAEIGARSGSFGTVAVHAAKVRAMLQASGHPELFGRVSSRIDFYEGMARLDKGDSGNALPLLQAALAAREELSLPTSPYLAEVQIAVAECQLALGHVAQARELAARAQAIHAQHKELGEHFREPLRRLLQRLAAAGHTAKAA